MLYAINSSYNDILLMFSDHCVTTDDNQVYYYEKLCICTGGMPKVIDSKNPFVIGIRDTSSVDELRKRLSNARRVAVIGNGGIALELV